MTGRYYPAGRPVYPDYQQVVQAYRTLREQYEQLIVHEQQQAQRIVQLERALAQSAQRRGDVPPVTVDSAPVRVSGDVHAGLEAQFARERAENDRLRAALAQSEQQTAVVEQDYRAALDRARQAEGGLAASEARADQLQRQLDGAGNAAEWRERYLRQQAEAENYRRRQERRFAQQAAEERRALLRDMLPLADNLELGLQHLAQDADAAADPRLQSYAANLRAVRQAFLDTLDRYNVRPLDALGEPFDPNRHEALGQIASDVPEGHVAQVVQNGYTDADGLVRPARVLVSAGVPAAELATER